MVSRILRKPRKTFSYSSKLMSAGLLDGGGSFDEHLEPPPGNGASPVMEVLTTKVNIINVAHIFEKYSPNKLLFTVMKHSQLSFCLLHKKNCLFFFSRIKNNNFFCCFNFRKHWLHDIYMYHTLLTRRKLKFVFIFCFIMNKSC